MCFGVFVVEEKGFSVLRVSSEKIEERRKGFFKGEYYWKFVMYVVVMEVLVVREMRMGLNLNGMKVYIGVGGVIFEDVLYLIDWLFGLLVRI